MKSIAVIEVRKMLTECYEVENYPCFVMAKDTYKEVKKLKPESKKEIKKALNETKTENWFPNQPYKAFNDTEKFKITIENENNLP